MPVILEARDHHSGRVHWERPLPVGAIALTKGEQSVQSLNDLPVAHTWRVEDGKLSTPHARFEWRNDRLFVERRMSPSPSTNPLWFMGAHNQDRFELVLGQFFITGDTRFSLVNDDEKTIALPDLEVAPLTFTAQKQIDVMAQLFKDVGSLIEISSLEDRVLQTVLDGLRDATAAAIVTIEPMSTADAPKARLLRRDKRGGELTVIDSLVHRAIQTERQPGRHFRDRQIPIDLREGASGGDTGTSTGNDWSVCVPLANTGEYREIGLYVNGRFPHSVRGSGSANPDSFLLSVIKFAQLAASQLSTLVGSLLAKKQQLQLESLLPPAIAQALAGETDLRKALKPRVVTATVLLCDLRGFSKLAEKQSLQQLLERTNLALSTMTGVITITEGVIGDFQGDSALGFWGWPQESDLQIPQAARAALGIRQKFRPGLGQIELLKDFSCGVGLAHGECIAGQLGTSDLLKVGVFGPVVNLAARLESLTKTFRVPVIVDEGVAKGLRGVGNVILRRLAKVQPANMTTILPIYELLPKPQAQRTESSDDTLRAYEAALVPFEAGAWDEASRQLSHLEDGPAKYLCEFMRLKRLDPRYDHSEWQGFISYHKPEGA